MHLSTILLLWFIGLVACQPPYPVPLPPGGRSSVHGWLILPQDQDEPTDPTTPVNAYFVHHTPEFWTDSPHNFQIILFGTLVPFPTVNNVTEVIPLPYPPASPLLVDEFTITPPGPFSLNDLLTTKTDQLFGAVYNGSFDTPYERYAIALATLQIKSIVTGVYLNISSAIAPLPTLEYYAYPRSLTTASGLVDLYLSHKIHAAPDFDHVVHVQIPTESCICNGCTGTTTDAILMAQGLDWVFPNTTNDVDHRLRAGDSFQPTVSTTNGSLTCKMMILEEIHCVIGPAFADNCP